VGPAQTIQSARRQWIAAVDDAAVPGIVRGGRPGTRRPDVRRESGGSPNASRPSGWGRGPDAGLPSATMTCALTLGTPGAYRTLVSALTSTLRSLARDRAGSGRFAGALRRVAADAARAVCGTGALTGKTVIAAGAAAGEA